MGIFDYLSEAVHTSKTMLEGLGITLKEYFNPPITIQYPDEKWPVTHWFRSVPVQKTDLESGAYKCTACNICVGACPIDVIDLKVRTNPETKKKEVEAYTIDMSRCMACNLCVESCPFDALVMANDYELAEYEKGNLLYDFDRLLKLGLPYSKKEVKGPKPAVPNWVFAERTGATEADLPPGVPLGTPSRPAPKPAPKDEATPAGGKEGGQS